MDTITDLARRALCFEATMAAARQRLALAERALDAGNGPGDLARLLGSAGAAAASRPSVRWALGADGLRLVWQPPAA
jgi:hypothetical protein